MGILYSFYSGRELGAWGERRAAGYLASRGYLIVNRRWHVREGEIDLIVREQATGCLVFVEVKTRRSVSHGNPEEAVGDRKKKRIVAAVNQYIARHPRCGEYRFDLLMLEVGVKVRIRHWRSVSLE